jgi:hypothetical protein
VFRERKGDEWKEERKCLNREQTMKSERNKEVNRGTDGRKNERKNREMEEERK